MRYLTHTSTRICLFINYDRTRIKSSKREISNPFWDRNEAVRYDYCVKRKLYKKK